jgi:hypothetical protein
MLDRSAVVALPSCRPSYALRYVSVLLAAIPATLTAEQPGLADPALEAQLRAVFPAVDSIMREFTGREHVPGAANML